MQFRSLFHPRSLVYQLMEASVQRRRMRRLQRTPARNLKTEHIDSLELLDLLREQPPRTIYDIGANVGTWTLLAKAIYPDAEIHAFEPLARLAKPFLENTRGLSSVYRHEVALGALPTSAAMKITDFVDASSLLDIAEPSVRHFNLHPSEEEVVDVVRLDDFVQEERIPSPSLIKLDIQGYELEAMRGADQALNAAYAVIVEVSFVEFYRGQSLFHDVVGYLATKRFYLRSLARCTPLGIPLLQTDALFMKNGIGSV